MTRIRHVLVGAVTCVILAAGPAAASASSVPGLKKVRDPGHVTGTIHGRCFYRDHGELSLAQAQEAIASDWMTAENELGIGGTGSRVSVSLAR